MQKIRLKIKWGSAKTDSDGKIIGWNDYVPGDVIEIDEKSNPLNATDYDIVKPKKQIIVKPEQRKEPKKPIGQK